MAIASKKQQTNGLAFAFDVPWATATKISVVGRPDQWIATFPVVGGIEIMLDFCHTVNGAN